MLFDVLDADGLEGAESHVESDFCALDAAVAEAGQDLRSEVEPGGGGGDGSSFAGVDGLVAVAIGGGVGAVDVRRERDVADLFHACKEVVHRSEADVALTKLAAGDDLGLKLVVIAEEKMLAYPNFAAWADETFPIIRIALQLAGEQDFDAAAKKVARSGIVWTDRLGLEACAASIEAGRKHARVVKDEEIAGAQEIGKIAELAVGESAGCGG